MSTPQWIHAPKPIAARKSIESGHPIRIAELSDLEPRVKKI
jgi:hypothetical protein